MGTASLRTRSDWTEHALIGLRDANGYIRNTISECMRKDTPRLIIVASRSFLTANVIGELTPARGQHRAILLKVAPLWLF